MATRRISILNSSINLLDENTWFAPYSTENSGTTQDPIVLVMEQGAVGYIQGAFRVPADYVDTPVLSIVWSSETTTNDVDFAFRHRTTDGSDSELLDTATSPTELEDTSVNNTGPSAASEQMITTISLTDTDLTAGSMCYFEFERDGATDTKADTITVWALDFQYADS